MMIFMYKIIMNLKILLEMKKYMNHLLNQVQDFFSTENHYKMQLQVIKNHRVDKQFKDHYIFH